MKHQQMTVSSLQPGRHNTREPPEPAEGRANKLYLHPISMRREPHLSDMNFSATARD
jgi:hypothetical protein